MARKGYPFSKRSEKQMTNLISSLLTGLIVAPFAIMDSMPNNTSNLNTEPVSKPVAIILLIIGIALTPLFLPLISLAFEVLDGIIIGPFIFFALIFIPLVVWGGILYVVIESFCNNKKTIKSKVDINVYQKLVLSLSKDSKIANNIRTDFNSIIKSNTEIKQRIEKLYNNIDTYKSRVRSLGIISKLKKKYIRNIQTTYREIHSLEVFNKIPLSADKPITEIEGDIFLNINSRFNAGYRINLDKLARKKNKTDIPYAINKVPTLSLQFNSIELYFFNDALAIITKEDYIVIDGDTILAEYRTIPLDVSLVNKNEKQFNVLDSRYRYFCKDCLILL